MNEEQKNLARMVLGYFGVAGGYEPGGFTGLILQACQKADPANRHRLSLGFPEHVAMMDACANTESGVADLQKLLGVAV